LECGDLHRFGWFALFLSSLLKKKKTIQSGEDRRTPNIQISSGLVALDSLASLTQNETHNSRSQARSARARLQEWMSSDAEWREIRGRRAQRDQDA
jgi:hypothetical protein